MGCEEVGSHAVELERRMHEVGSVITIVAIRSAKGDQPRWSVSLARSDVSIIVRTGMTVREALWAVFCAAGLTDGLTPP